MSIATATSACWPTWRTTATGRTRCSTRLGHGAYDIGFDRGLPWLLRDCHLTVTEGIAILMGRLAQDAEWLRDVAGLAAAEVESLERALARPRPPRAARLHARWVHRYDELRARALYADPEAAHGRLVGACSPLPASHPGRGPRRARLAAKIHVACAPVYYTRISTGTSSHRRSCDALDRVAGRPRRPARRGAFLAERVFRPGQSLRWDQLIEAATGEPLTASHAARDIAAGLST
jgi:peptidyl-dipeptidase A